MASSTSSSSGHPTSTSDSSSSSTSSSSGNPTSSLLVSTSSSPPPLNSAAHQTSPLPFSSPTSTLPLSYLFSEISHPVTTSIPISMSPTTSFSESHPLLSGLHQQQTFPTSTASLWTPPQPAIPGPVFPSITTSIGIDQIASGLHGLNLSGGFPPHMSNNGGLPFSLPTSSPFFPSALAAPNVTNLVTVKLTNVEDYLA